MSKTVRTSNRDSSWDANGVESLTVTNGMDFVSLVGAVPKLGANISGVLKAEDAVELAIALLNAAANVREGIHGNNEAVYDDRKRAHKSLNWAPPVAVPGELFDRLMRASTADARNTAIALIKKELVR